MGRNRKSILYPVILFLISVTITGIISVLSGSGTKETIEQYMVKNEASLSASEDSESYYRTEKTDLEIIFRGSVIRIDTGETREGRAFEVYIDGEFSKEFSDNKPNNNKVSIEYSRTYGEMNIIISDDTYLGSITVNAPAADIYINGIDSDSIRAESNAGCISCYDLFCSDIKAMSQSGHIYIEDCESVVTAVETETGNITVHGHSREFYITSENGSIEFVPDRIDLRADITTENGDIRTCLKKNEEIVLNIESSCGDINMPESFIYNDNGYVRENDSPVFNIKTTDGCITIEVK